MDTIKKLRIYRINGEFYANWLRKNKDTNEIMAYDEITTEYLDKIIQFVRVNQCDDFDYLCNIVYLLHQDNEFSEFVEEKL